MLVNEWTVCGVRPGIVDKDVEAAEAFECDVNASVRGVFIGGVGGETYCAAELCGRSISSVLSASGQNHVGAQIGQALCRGLADTAGGAGNQRCLAFQIGTVH